MPCWEVNTYSVEFNMAMKDRLLKAIAALGLSSYQENRGQNIVIGYGADGIGFQLDSQTVKCSPKKLGVVNQIKRKYSEIALEELAVAKKMKLKKLGNNKFQFIKI